MLRAGLLGLTVLANSVDAAPAAPAAHAASPARPHILFLMSDSHDGRALDPTDATVFPAQVLPNMYGRLAKGGVNFVRSYCHSPQCTPSRSSMYTGRRTDQIKVWMNGLGLAGNPAAAAAAPEEDRSPDYPDCPDSPKSPDSLRDPTPARNNPAAFVAAKACTNVFGEATCLAWARAQNVTATFKDTLSAAGYNVSIFGKTHTGADILAEGPPGFDAPIKFLGTMARGAGILKPSGDWLVKQADGSELVANQTDPLCPWRYVGKTHKDPNTLRSCLDVLRGVPADGTAPPQLLHCR